MIGSLRLRLLVGTSVATTLILALLGLIIFVSMQRALIREFDAASLIEANTITSMAEQSKGRITFETDQELSAFSPGRRPEYFEICTEDGGEIFRSKSLGEKHLPVVSVPNGIAYQDLTLPDGRRGRLLSVRFTTRAEHEDENDKKHKSAEPALAAVLTLARETTVLDSTLASLRWLLFVLIFLAILVSGIVLLIVVAVTMRSVKRLAKDIESLDENDLSHRLPLENIPPELSPVVDRLNALLSRLNDTFSREKAFTADVAHELRTPLAGLHTTLQVCRSKSRDRDAYEAMIDKCLKLSGGMRSIVETLLLLARADAGQLPLEHSRFDLDQLVRECSATFQEQASARGVSIEYHLTTPCIVETDADKLRIVLRNLLDNAVSYVDDGGKIAIAVRQDGAFASVEITNTGSRIEAEHAHHLFERFWRGDGARSDTGVHCGLGLALSQRLTTLLGGRISARSDAALFTALVSLPASVLPPYSLAANSTRLQKSSHLMPEIN